MTIRRLQLGTFFVLVWLMAANADDLGKQIKPLDESKGRKTLGGTQFWTDNIVLHRWRIQQNIAVRHFRLLNSNNRVVHTGSYDRCVETLNKVSVDSNFPPLKEDVVITMHGLGRTRNSMVGLGEHLQAKGGYTWINVGYASTRSEVKDHAEALKKVINHLVHVASQQDPVVRLKINFVGHSMGNIVIRKLLRDYDQLDKEVRTWQPANFVMLAPPNQGSAMANLFKKNRAFKLLAGVSGQNLSTDWEELQKELTVPKIPFGIIAGGKGTQKGYNPLLEGDDDLIVSVQETKLSGAADFLVVPSIHTYIMDKPIVKDATLKFLQLGFFKSEEERKRLK